MRASVLRPVIAIALVALGAVVVAVIPAASQTGAEPRVDAAVQVTSDPRSSRAHMAPAIAVHPDDERVLVVAAADTFSGQCGVQVSTNAGLSWNAVASPDIPAEFPNCTFVNFGPVVDVTFSPDGTLYYALSGFDPVGNVGKVYLARSENLGATWDVTELPWIGRDLSAGEVGIDAVPSVAVDPNDPDNVYVGWGSNWATYSLSTDYLQGQLYYWDVIERVYVAASHDGGATFGEAVDVGAGLELAPGKEGIKPPPQVLVGNEGEVYAFFGEYARAGTRDNREGTAEPASIYQAVSTDGGETYSNKAIFTGPTPTGSSDWTWVPRAGIVRDTGGLVVAWENMSSADDPVEMSVIRSADGGETWSEPVAANDVTPQRQWNYPESYPNLSVSPDGRVDLAWYDWRDDPYYTPDDSGGALQEVYYTFSTDGGATWAPNVKVTDRAIDRRIGPYALGAVRGPLGVASVEEGAFVAWDDTRNGDEETQAQDIYFARVNVGGEEMLLSSGGSSTSALEWSLVGVAIGLGIGGVALLVALAALKGREPSAARR